MKTPLTAIAAAVFLLLPITGFAAYVIHLKDGTQFVTDQYYEEGDQIRFKRYGGFIGIEKELVSEIEEVEDLPEEKQVRTEPGGLAAEGEAEKEDKIEEGPDGGKRLAEQQEAIREEKADRMQAFLDEKRQIMREKEEAISGFREAKAAKDMEKKNQYWNKLLSLQKKLAELRERVRAEHGGEIP